jgi:hypothetical protein
MGKNKPEEAFEVFKPYLRLFPASWNAYGSYGEAIFEIWPKGKSHKNVQEIR